MVIVLAPDVRRVGDEEFGTAQIGTVAHKSFGTGRTVVASQAWIENCTIFDADTVVAADTVAAADTAVCAVHTWCYSGTGDCNTVLCCNTLLAHLAYNFNRIL